MVSVIVPVYNNENYIERCIRSILEQSLKEIEIVVIDDGSTDGTADIIDALSRIDYRIIAMHKQHEGLIAARRDGLNLAKGKWIGFVDGDDYIDPGMYEELYRIMVEHDCDLVSAGIIRDYCNGESAVVYDNFEEKLYEDLGKEIFPSMLFDFTCNDFGIYCNLVTKLFRRDLIKRVLLNVHMDISYGEDAAVFYKYCMKCRSIYVMQKAFYHYCIRKDSMSSARKYASLDNSVRLYETLKEDFESSDSKNVLMKQLKRYMLDIVTHHMELFYDINPGLLNRWEFRVSDKVFDKDYILYGGGGCGQAFYHYLNRRGLTGRLKAWVDRNAEGVKSQCDYNVESIEAGIKKDYEYIIIAIKNKGVIDTIKKELVEVYDVSEEKIITMTANEYSFFSEALY